MNKRQADDSGDRAAPVPTPADEEREPVTHELEGTLTIDVSQLGNREEDHDG